MPLRSGVTGPPASYLASGEWPDGALVVDAPMSVAFAQEICRRLKAAVRDRDITTLAEDAELSRSAIYDVLSGRTWPDVVTLSKLQIALGIPLWPSEIGVSTANAPK